MVQFAIVVLCRTYFI